jgi:hypothetical protein
MNRKQLLIVIVVLVVLGALGAWVQWSDKLNWDKTDALAGKKLLPALSAVAVSEIDLRRGADQTTLVKHGNDWTVKERNDFPADVTRIAQLLDRLLDMKITQTEKVPADKRADYQLAEAGAVAGGAAPEGLGTTLELKDDKGKSLARLVLGKILTKPGMVPSIDGGPPHEGEVPYGRYVQSTDAGVVAVVSEPLAAAEATPPIWLNKDLVRVDPAKSITSIGPGGDTRWTLTKDTAKGLWGWPGAPAVQPDPQKAQDVVSSLYLISAKDVVPDPAKVQTGLDKPVTIRAETPEGIVYTLKIGAKADADSYYASLDVSGEPAKTRPPVKDEKPEDMAKNDKAYADALPKLVEQVEKEKKFANWTYQLPKYASELLIRDRAQLMSDKKPDAKKK